MLIQVLKSLLGILGKAFRKKFNKISPLEGGPVSIEPQLNLEQAATDCFVIKSG